MSMKSVDIKDKLNLTIEEAAAYTGIGIHKIREISSAPNCPFVLYVGAKRLLRRKGLEDYLAAQIAI